MCMYVYMYKYIRFFWVGTVGRVHYTYFQWTEDRQGFQIQYLTIDTWSSVLRCTAQPPGQVSKVKYWI